MRFIQTALKYLLNSYRYQSSGCLVKSSLAMNIIREVESFALFVAPLLYGDTTMNFSNQKIFYFTSRRKSLSNVSKGR